MQALNTLFNGEVYYKIAALKSAKVGSILDKWLQVTTSVHPLFSSPSLYPSTSFNIAFSRHSRQNFILQSSDT